MQAREVVGKTQPHVKVRNATSLELQHPQVMHVREAAAQGCQPCVEMLFDGAPVRAVPVVCHAELRYERGRRVASEEPKAAAGMVGKSLYLCSFGGGNVRTLSGTCPYNLHA